MTNTLISPPDHAEMGDAVKSMAATAFVYLRVSSDGQMNKAHDPEGYSIPGQRDACYHRAASLNAEVTGEYVERGVTGRNMRRPALQRLLADLEAQRPDYVIVYDLSRVARDDFDALWLLREIELRGAKLESTMERTDNTPAGRLLYTVMAGVNAFRSRSDAQKVRMGLQRKHADGGTIAKAPIGYLNTRGRIDGREVRVVVIDPERAPLIRMAFEAYAAGNYFITEIRDMLEDAGLRTRQTPKHPSAPLSRSQVHRMLTDDYYIGVVTWGKAKNPKGRHEPLIDRQTFEKVAEVLRTATLKGNRTRKHRHYLRGSLFCGHCGRRMVFQRVRGRGGIYDYFGCTSHQGRRGSCGARHLSVSKVEKAIEIYYSRVRLTPAQLERVREAVREHAEGRMQVARQESERHARRLQELQREQQTLLQLAYKKSIDEDVLAAEQERIDVERREARRWDEIAAQDAHEIMAVVDEALLLLRTAQIAYRQATPELRRLLNQALFEGLLVRDEEIDGTPAPWAAEIHRLAEGPFSGQEDQQGGQNGHDPLSRAVGFNKASMVRRAGLEPAPPD
jgi:site-specific DNA recombinase